jgi:hypothetical protein
MQAGGCTDQTATTSVTVNTLPAATISYAGTPFCSSQTLAQPVTRTGTASGTYTAPAGLSIDSSTGAITPSTSTAGTYTVTYTMQAGGCTDQTATTSVTVNTLPAATISYDGTPFCKTVTVAQAVTRTGTAGGTYTAPAGLSIDSSTGAITPSTSTAGTYIVTYTMLAGGCTNQTATTSVTITALPTAVISYAGSPFCTNFGIGTVTFSGTSGGTYSALPLGLDLNTSTGDITTLTSTPGGPYSVKYTIAAAGGCAEVTATTPVTINLEGSWKGGGTEDWNTTDNWDCKQLPLITTNVLVATGKSPYPILSSGATGTAKDITLQASTSLTVDGNTLQIAGNISNSGSFTASSGTIEMAGTGAQTIPSGTFTGSTIQNLIVNNGSGVTLQGPLNVTGIVKAASGNLASNGNLTLVSSAAQTALIDGSGSGEVLGDVTMQRYLSSAGYKYFSSPFTGLQVSDFAPYVNLSASFPNFYKYDENHLASGLADMTGWTAYTSGAMVPMNGYAANFGPSLTATQPLEFTGTVNNGQVGPLTLYNHNKIYTLGFNLVGNPYPSPIDWNAVSGWTKTNIDNAIYFFDASLGSDQYSGLYSSYIGGISTGGSTNIIPSMQGFFVHVSNASGALGMTNSVRTNNLNPAFKTAKVDNRTILRFAAGFDGKKSLPDGFVLYFDPNSTMNFDIEKDALKMMNTDMMAPSIFALTPDSQKVSINGIPIPENSLTKIPLGISTQKDGWVTFTAKDISRLPSNMNLYLQDTEANLHQDLRRNPNYRFYQKKGENNKRLILMFSISDIPIAPVEENKMFTVSRLGELLVIQSNLEMGVRGKLMVTNMLGQVHLEKTVTGQETVELDNAIRSGVYIITLISGKNRESEKVLIRKDYE